MESGLRQNVRCIHTAMCYSTSAPLLGFIGVKWEDLVWLKKYQKKDFPSNFVQEVIQKFSKLQFFDHTYLMYPYQTYIYSSLECFLMIYLIQS